MDLLLDRLEEWQDNLDIGMSKDKYLEMQSQLGLEPDPARCPPGIEDFPEVVVNAINIYSLMGDRVYPEIGYIGKDYTNLPILLQVFGIDIREYEVVVSVLSSLDSHSIRKSQAKLKAEYAKMKRSKGA